MTFFDFIIFFSGKENEQTYQHNHILDWSSLAGYSTKYGD